MSYEWLKVKKNDISFTTGFKNKHLCTNKSDADTKCSTTYSTGKNHLTTEYNFLLNSDLFKFKANPKITNQIYLLMVFYGWYYVDGVLQNKDNLAQTYQVRGAAYVNKGTLTSPQEIKVNHIDTSFDISKDNQALAWMIKIKNKVRTTMSKPSYTVKTVIAKKI